MENDVLKNKIAPWQEKGRWYKGVYEFDGTNYKIHSDESDQFLVDSFIGSSGAYVRVSPKTNVLQAVLDAEKQTFADKNSTLIYWFNSTNGSIIQMPHTANQGIGSIYTLWVFIKE